MPESKLTARIIPCLDCDGNRVVKGTKFKNLQDAGDPVEVAMRYSQEGADEIIFLDISATIENRATVLKMVEKVAKNVFVPLTVGGGIASEQDVKSALDAGADKVSINSAAIKDHSLIPNLVKIFGSQCIVLAADARYEGDDWVIYAKGGSQPTKLSALSWCQQMTGEGRAGEILLTSIDRDGQKKGFDINLLRKVSECTNVPLIASGGAGTLQHLRSAIIDGGASAVLAASIFHYQEYTIAQAKQYLIDKGINTRPITW